MKKITTIFILAFITVTVFSQNLLTESFDATTFPPTSWSINPVANTFWTRQTAGTNPTCTTHSGAGMARAYCYLTATGSYDLITPGLTFAASTAYQITFWMYRDAGSPAFADKIDLEVNTSASATGATILGTVNRSMTLAPTVATAGWYKYTFVVPAAITATTKYLIFHATTAYGNNIFIDDVSVDVLTPPGIAIIGAPLNNSTGIFPQANLNWTAPTTGGSVKGYKLYFGTNNPPNNLMNGMDLGNVLFFDPFPDMDWNIPYYWKVVPYNESGNATGSAVWTFNTVLPGTITGQIFDCVTHNPIQGVTVSIVPNMYSTFTDDNGYFSILAIPAIYSVVFSMPGYQPGVIPGVVVSSGNVTNVLSASLCEVNNPPGCATATIIPVDAACRIDWCAPQGPYEMLYDDGSAENYTAWAEPTNMNAVKFTPKGYPATVKSGRFYVGTGSFPTGGNIIGSTFTVKVLDDDGVGGLPGTQIGVAVTASVANSGWITVNGLSSTITSGDFYLAMVQNQAAPNCSPIGVDESMPKAYKSYSRFVSNGEGWVLSPYQDFMIHAIIDGPSVGGDNPITSIKRMVPGRVDGITSLQRSNTIPGIEADATIIAPSDFAPQSVHHYELARLSGFDPDLPLPGSSTFTFIYANLTTQTCTEGTTTWANLAKGWYAYGIRAVYPNGDVSPYTYTNIVPHKMMAKVTFDIKLICGNVPAEGSLVTFTGNDYPHSVFTATLPASGIVTFDVTKGNYTLNIIRANYDLWASSYSITNDFSTTIITTDTKYVPRNFVVDPLTLQSTWYPPQITAVYQDFEAATPFPPTGWTKTQVGGPGWISQNSSYTSGNWAIPAHTRFAFVNDDAVDYDNSKSYLITPALNLTQTNGFTLKYDAYFDAALGGTATVEYTTDDGATWHLLQAVPALSVWTTYNVDLSAISGTGGLLNVKIGFHYDDGGLWADGMGIDNVMVYAGVNPTLGYGVFMDGTRVNDVAPTVLTYSYSPTDLTYGTSHVAAVAGKYCSGYSNPNTYTFTSKFLYPAKQVDAVANVNSVILTWDAAIPGDSPVGTMVDYSGIVSSGTLSESFTIGNMDPGTELTTTIDASTAETEIKYCGAGNTSIGTGAAADFMVAARFTPTELSGYYGTKQLTKIKIQLAATNTWSKVVAKVWKGGSATNAGAEVFSKEVTADIVLGAYTIITLPTPILLEAGNEYWVGYEVVATGGYPAVCDAGPRVEGKGNMMYYGGVWTTLFALSPTLNYNWNVVGVIDDAGSVPLNNLISYTVYRDGVQIAEVPKTELTYWDQNLMPKTYCYDIKAKYDLTPYGAAYTGLVGESMTGGHPCVTLHYGYPMPFLENWTTAQPDINQWTVGPHWVIDGQTGMPVPSMKFKWDPLISNYESSLESYFMDATLINTTTPYRIFLDYDLKLDDRTFSSNEKLAIEITNDNGSTWTTVKEYTNSGDFDWKNEQLNISNAAKGKVFKVRFRATGVLSGDIYYWAIDNIHIYVQYYFYSPTLVSATRQGTPMDDIRLIWVLPANGDSPDAITGFDVYRRAYFVQPTGADPTNTGSWTKINPSVITTLEYIDADLSNLITNCYEYHIKTLYTEGVSAASNIKYDCIYVGVDPSVTNEVKVYPNPATSYVRIDLTNAVNEIAIYNSLGAVVAQQYVMGENTITINTSNYAAGAYSVKFTTTSGENFSRKFVVTE